MVTSDVVTRPPITMNRHIQASPLKMAYVVLAGVVILDTFATSLTRLTLNSGMPPLAIAVLRTTLAWFILTPIVLRKYPVEVRSTSRKDALLTLSAGVGFMLHLVLGFWALNNTSIMIMHVMFSTSLFWVALLEWVFLKARFPRLVLVGLILAFVGSLIIAVSSEKTHFLDDFRPEQAIFTVFADAVKVDMSLWGMIAALSSAAAGAVYLVIGRKARQNMTLLPYMWGLYSSGMIIGLVVVAITGTWLSGYRLEAYLWLLLLLLVAQFGIHGGLNYVMRQLSATFVGIAEQVPTVTATIVAIFLFSEIPHFMEIIGGVVIMVGVFMAILGQRKKHGAL